MCFHGAKWSFTEISRSFHGVRLSCKIVQKNSYNVKICIFHLCLSKSMPRHISLAAHVVVICLYCISHMAISSRGNQMIICSVGHQTRHFHDSTATISTSRKARTQKPRLTITMRLQCRCPIFIFVHGSTCKSNIDFAHCASSALSLVACGHRIAIPIFTCPQNFKWPMRQANNDEWYTASGSKHRLIIFLKSTFYMHVPAIKSSFKGRCGDAEISWRSIHIYLSKGTCHDSTASCGCNLVKSLDQTFHFEAAICEEK